MASYILAGIDIEVGLDFNEEMAFANYPFIPGKDSSSIQL